MSQEITAAELDKQDQLAHKKEQFIIPDSLIYLDGNSLGPLTKMAKMRVAEVVEQQWGNDLITSWNKNHWIDLPQQVGGKIAAIIGAESDEVICCDSTSVNLFKVLSICLSRNPQRTKMLSQGDNFPTDLYMAQGLSQLLNDNRIEVVTVSETDIRESLTEDIAVLFLTQVNFRSGFIHDIEAITRLAHEKGILVIWDLAHSAGVLPLELSDWNVDFAIGCGYKYLNGGPGAPAFVYAAKRYHDQLNQPLFGWMGHAEPFAFDPCYQAAQSMNQFLAGTPAIISMSILDAALDIYEDIDIAAIRKKSLQLSDYFMTQVKQSRVLDELLLITPDKHQIRGSQVAYKHPHAYAICQALIAENVITDFRAPDILRIGFSPLYLSFNDIETAIKTLEQIFVNQTYLEPVYQKQNKVT